MTRIKLKYIDSFIDRHGRRRHYFRRPGGRRIPLPGLAGSTEFMAAYQAAIDDQASPVIKPRSRGAHGTFERLAFEYFASSDFRRLKPSSQRAYRLVIERFVAEHGHRIVAQMRREHVKRIMALKADTPGAANDLLKKIRVLIRCAIDLEWRRDDPTARLRRYPSGEFHTWDEAEIAAFEAHWPTGSRERTAFALALHTGQRRSDLVRMAWPDIDDQLIHVTQLKTGARLAIPLHPELKRVLDQWPRSHMMILTTSFGKPFAAAGFGNWMADTIRKAGLPDHCVLHGLRKAAARRLAEAGCSEKEIAAITGHATLAEVQRYTKAANQLHLAKAAVARLSEQKTDKNFQP